MHKNRYPGLQLSASAHVTVSRLRPCNSKVIKVKLQEQKIILFISVETDGQANK